MHEGDNSFDGSIIPMKALPLYVLPRSDVNEFAQPTVHERLTSILFQPSVYHCTVGGQKVEPTPDNPSAILIIMSSEAH